jgi:membrane peptidoglycan carboxypeptidase
VRNDAPVKIGKWTPENYDNKYRGNVTLSDALTHSLNTVAAQLVMEVGPKTVVKTARRLGIEARSRPTPRLRSALRKSRCSNSPVPMLPS